MPSTPYTTGNTWDAASRYTASGDTDIRLGNIGAFTIYFEITNSDAMPAIAVEQGQRLIPGEGIPMQLADGARLWLAGLNSAASVLE